MFPARFFPLRMFAKRYWPKVGATFVAVFAQTELDGTYAVSLSLTGTAVMNDQLQGTAVTSTLLTGTVE